MKKINVAVIGASGYTGAELIRILVNHPNVKITSLVANSSAGKNIDEIFSHLKPFKLPALQRVEDVDFSQDDVAFCCLPHTTSQEVILVLMENFPNLKIIDLSADFRLDDVLNYEKWYKNSHKAPEIQQKAVYGLSEINRDKIRKSSLIACPGCYPTSSLLPLIPLLENKLIDEKTIIIDSKSGTSGAGRSLKQGSLFCEVNNSVKAYSLGAHRHIAEIEQELSKAANSVIELDFTPHLIPINRGIISTIYVDIKNNFNIDDLKNCLKTKYEDEYFVNIIDEEPMISNVVATNFCEIAIFKGRTKNKAIIVSVIDNLCKGASGQGVQNMNIIYGIDERSGLEFAPTFP
jgi:N-acetyl-gamma-glutamyl-phosphate reductase